ncbi:MAG: zf-HC2 domain-containing protein [Chloroflexi bacterium]|nr:MAG: zf-HC2 domain-containing protein [Chloroflexota bacterium]
MSITCEELLAYLSEYIDNNLDEELSEAAREHLATCHRCNVVLDSTQKAILLYKEHSRELVIPPIRREKLYERIAEAFRQRPTPDQ